jgi:hypothetical protein
MNSIYYQYNPDRLSACPVTVHALLHIADSIEASGPVWASWAFPMERYCGLLNPTIKSWRYPFSSIDRYVTEVAQLTQLRCSIVSRIYFLFRHPSAVLLASSLAQHVSML